MTTTRFLWTTLAALGGVVAAIGLQATAQDGPGPATGLTRVVEDREDGQIVQTAQGQPATTGRNPYQPRIRYQTEEFDERRPDGSVHRRTVQFPVVQLNAAPDPESQKLLEQEQAAAQEVRRMADNLLGIDAPEAQQVEQKKKLRDKLAEIFDLQQQRRNHEIARIEDRLAKLKETLKKREAVKDSIVDRRLETMTGGVDELGWEETFPQGPSAGRYPTLALPEPVPVPGDPNYGGPTRKPLPPPVAPGPYGPPGAPPAPPAPALTPSPAR